MKGKAIIDLCLENLKQVLEIWPKTNLTLDEVKLNHRKMERFLTTEFDYKEMLSPIVGYSEVDSTKIKNEFVTIDFYDCSNDLHRAKFKIMGSQCFLVSLTFECPICFGQGVNDDNECTMCGGLGWGVK